MSGTSQESSAPTCNCTKVATVFTCTNAGVDLVEPPFNVSTVLDFNVSYAVETRSKLADFESQLMNLILQTAVIGALQCISGGPLFSPGVNPIRIPMSTVVSSQTCVPVFNGTTCTVYQTSFQVFIDSAVDADVSTALGYMFLQDQMNHGAFVQAIPLLQRVKYVGPNLNLPVNNGTAPTSAPLAPSSANATVAVSPWTLGAVITMCKWRTFVVMDCALPLF
jgi:hypothetical protein